jgi:hypothetical protein
MFETPLRAGKHVLIVDVDERKEGILDEIVKVDSGFTLARD